MPTYCEQCRHVYRVNKADPPWRWMCAKHKRSEGFGYVTRTSWDKHPPYLYCVNVNDGFCPLFEEQQLSTEQVITPPDYRDEQP